ncbi:olfactory receptor 14A16-like [Crotalus tigris]|uniref:olfactory receptor 14A16-like n=1 Tax=Crotalus tigris TaxID=88082 RepID=UPI00192F8281|nr:olfactory receptor 14A16-like [Crotalus tigris]XP_039225923.1 olfactory receptor 14A16-like [Crotalus tigris]
MDNMSSPSNFLLLQFSAVWELQILHFLLFLILYLAIVLGNLLIISAVIFDHYLHTPMYFFLMNLAILDLGSISTIIPKSMGNSFMNSRNISYSECVVQVFCFISFVESDFFLLTVMAYDRYVAICHPLHYGILMNRQACAQIVLCVWLMGIFNGAMHTTGTFAISFCSNVVNQFYCEIPQLLKLSCSDSYQPELTILVINIMIEGACFVFIIITYVLIFTAVLKIPFVHGRQKAFATCLPHLTVFSIFIFTGWFAYLKPPSNTPSSWDLALTMIYTFVPPLLNPVIYSMRNKELKVAFTKLFLSACSSTETYFNVFVSQ